MSRKLRFLMDQVNKAGIMSSHSVLQSDTYLEDIETQLAEHEHEIIEMNSNSEKLQQSYNELLEFKIVLQKACNFLVSSHGHAVSEERELEENVYSNEDFVETPFLFEQIQDALQRATFDSNSQVGAILHSMDALESPPTYFRTNSFTNPYQEIVDAYGVARYQEANPAVYTTLIRDAHTTGLVKYREPYPFGVDPSWRGSRSELSFLNSLKMKMSILFGVVHMNLGILLSFFNARFFGSSLDIRYQFVPQMIFLNSLFGYLSLLIVVKWCTGSQADLYHIMIYMFLSPFDNLGENELFWGQRPLQILLLLLALIAVPWMLFPKPFILKKLHNERFQGRNYGVLNTSEADLEVEPDSARQHHEEFNFSEVFVHQMIHSIEFVLGSVSNTASYLRLWALSLAHSELSTVFYEKVLLLAWGYDNLIIRLVGLVVFAFATAFILLMMETLSAFLHALRLHWVEFQNKFYHGDGYKFRPFSFATLTEDEN